MHIEIRRGHAYWARAVCGEYEGFGDTTAEALADLAARMGMDWRTWQTWHIAMGFRGDEQFFVLYDPNDRAEIPNRQEAP